MHYLPFNIPLMQPLVAIKLYCSPVLQLPPINSRQGFLLRNKTRCFDMAKVFVPCDCIATHSINIYDTSILGAFDQNKTTQ